MTETPDETPDDPTGEPDVPRVPTTWKEARAEIAQEPGNHGSFAFGCSIAVIVVVAAFFVVRVFLMP
jgi:hypothetical protein